jgi:hypothetical protein
MRIIAFCAALALLTGQLAAAADDDIVFAPKNFSDLGEYVGISGTMTGADIAYKNNTYAIACVKVREECLVTYIQQVGPNQVGRLDYPYGYPIVSWTPTQVVASEPLTNLGCSRVTITINRKTETAMWVEEPVNQSTPQCAKSDGRVRKYTVEQSIGWKRLNGK